MLTIISRYILKTPVTWSYEVSILAYMWTMFFGVGKALQQKEHVVFSLLYDHVSPRKQLIFDILSNLLIVLLIGIALVPSVNSLLQKKMITGVLKIPYTVAFAPLIYMFVNVMIRSIIELRVYVNELIRMMRNPK
ncbi:TRAP transporter small permease [uncultured Sphaerochaeta sp.]|uniref:TRAP transporter small permease n=1 Tax=uncultured Sphaerochaeta sp. TaxID=886478 RepID=UPI002A0A112D|nr:TRAP transporter small permease [uncultured Sphaerochaeta sp.]